MTLAEMTEEQFFQHALKGDREARELVALIHRLAHLIDDIVDRDKPLTRRDAYEAFWIAMVQIPSNGFYRRYTKELIPLAASSLLNWVAATEIETAMPAPTLDELHIAHVIRYSVADTFIVIATLIGGAQWGFEMAAEMRKRCQRDPFKNYLKEHDHA